MPHHVAILLGHQRDAQGTRLAQGINDELFGVRRVRRAQERSGRNGVDGRYIRW